MYLIRLVGGSPRADRAWPLAWPSPSGPPGRQRLRAQGWVPKMLSAERLERIFGCPCGWRGRPGQCAAFQPRRCDIFTASGPSGAGTSAWPWCWRARQRGYGGDRRRPVTGAAVRGSRRVRRARVRRTRRKLPPSNGETPGEPCPPTAGHPGRSSLSTARARPRCSRPGAVRPGAPEACP
jgi:hypothetical protein